MTIREALIEATTRLNRLQAEVLLAHILSVEREYLYAHDDRVLTLAEYQALEDAVYERLSGVPLQYIIGRQEFYGRYFHVSPAVLIPRPETEHIIEAVLEMRPASPRIIDVGTGSGCISVTLALEIPGAEVFASDISEEALHVARQNASTLGATVGFICMDVLDAVRAPFDFVVSNPPYVRPGDLHRLQREVRDHEPHVALFTSDDELGIYRRIVPAAHELLRSGGHLIMEIGIGMEERVLTLFDTGWKKLPTKADLQGIPRSVIARKE